MHEIQIIVTDVRGVRPSVTRLNTVSLCKNGRADQDAVCGEHSWRPMLDGGPNPLQRGGKKVGENFANCMEPLHISGTAEARDLEFDVHNRGLEALSKKVQK